MQDSNGKILGRDTINFIEIDEVLSPHKHTRRGWDLGISEIEGEIFSAAMSCFLTTNLCVWSFLSIAVSTGDMCLRLNLVLKHLPQ